ncbi:glycosyltransferase family 9 protein [Spirosoma sp. KNUC1025]|uniref:glycosyltransferase family 9 protein n=1 Tax=Spirosoma sp. KNUC1025 TaxID=2894082 RepID=UPI00386B9F8F|nr:glycosyltransferase family 9 protein [Spirosoma sp. KNUC1025]
MLQRFIRLLKTSPLLVPVLALIDLTLLAVDTLAVWTSPRSSLSVRTLVIMRFDVLGDYLLFRNYLSAIRQSATYRNFRIVFVGNKALKTIAETFDNELVDTFLWVDIYKLSTRPLYRFRVVRQVRQLGADVVFCPTYSRVLVLDDFMARVSGASERIGCQTDYVNIKRWEAALGDQLYTRLIDSGPGFVFELERDRRIVEGFLQNPVTIQFPKLAIERAQAVDLPNRFVVFSLGAGQDFKIWPPARFAVVANFIQKYKPGYQFVVTGVADDRPLVAEFKAALTDTSQVQDLTGQLSLPQLVYVLSKATLLITNESGAVHLAASVSTPVVSVSQGKALVRWHPYPADFHHSIHYVYPDFIRQHSHDLMAIAPMFKPESPFAITDISVERVIEEVDKQWSVR